MKLKILLALVLLACNITAKALQKEFVDYVDPFIGTSNSRWMLGPYAQVPFGMVQLGPDNQGNVWMGGYEYSICNVSAFSHIHAWTMGGLAVMPTNGELVLNNPSIDSSYKGSGAGYHSRIQKEQEKASPGYYSVYLYDYDIKAEMTATTHCGVHRYTFKNNRQSRILFDLLFPTEYDYGFSLKDAVVEKVSNTELEGYADCQSGNWSRWNKYKLHFVIHFSRPFDSLNAWQGEKVSNDITSFKGKDDAGVFTTFSTSENEQITVCTAFSLVSIDQARINMEEEVVPLCYDFDRVHKEARKQWNDILGKIEIEGASEEEKVKFYTNLYRTYTGKQTWSDVNGLYVDAEENIRQLDRGKMYGGDAFWNSFWNLNGLWSIITPEITDNWVTTQLEMFKNTGWTSKGPAGLEYSGIMEGSHETALMVSAFLKGIRKDGLDIYNAVYKNVSIPGITPKGDGVVGNPLLDKYDRYGYMPSEFDVVSKTLDYAYDDWCVGQLAKAIGKNKDAKKLLKRSMNYKNVFHPEHKYVVRRDSSGIWDKSFDRFSNKGFIEGNSWQYSFYVPHDIKGVIGIIGKDEFNNRLEYGFKHAKEHNFTAHAFDRTRGQSAEYYINHGNEINMQAAFLFNYSGQPWNTQYWSRMIMNVFYGNTPYHGWEGDEDEGQMSAWYVMSAIGFFEMTGGCDIVPTVDLGSPIFDKITIHLDRRYYKGETFVIETKNNSMENVYVQRAYLNGKRLQKPQINFSDISNGGVLTLEMGPTPAYECYAY